MKAATAAAKTYTDTQDISIHAAREGGDDIDINRLAQCAPISIHAAREGGDCKRSYIHCNVIRFQSTPPVKAATMNEHKSEVNDLNFNPRRP